MSSFGRRLGSRRYASLRALAAVLGAAYLFGACDFPATYEPLQLPVIGSVQVHFISMASYSATTIAWTGSLDPDTATSTDGVTTSDLPETPLGPVARTEVLVSPWQGNLRPGHWTFEISVRGVRGAQGDASHALGSPFTCGTEIFAHATTHLWVAYSGTGCTVGGPGGDPPPRVDEGLLVLYTFEEGSGETVHDVSGVNPRLDLTIETSDVVGWIDGALSINGSGLVASAGPAAKVINGAKASNEITIEAWVTPTDTDQTGPARIVTLSTNPSFRNFTLGQVGEAYDVRLRHVGTSDNGEPSLATPSGSLAARQTHVVYTRNSAGEAKIYVNGKEEASGSLGSPPDGDFSNWDETYRLGLANEFEYNNPIENDRPWLGDFDLVAVYDRALSQNDVLQNFLSGPNPDTD